MKNTKKTMRDIAQQPLEGRRVIVRCDFNVPILEGKIVSDIRIRKSLATLYYLLKKGAKIVVISHLGQPDGKVCESLRLQIIYDYLKENWPIHYLPADFRSPQVQKELSRQANGSIFLLENIRFYPEEQQSHFDAPLKRFCESLGMGSDFYVNEAFSVSHRKHASVVHLPKVVRCCAMGYLFAREMNYLHDCMLRPKRPFVAVIGGAKVSSKLPLLMQLLPKVDYLLVGGAMVFTLLKALGHSVGKSQHEVEYLQAVRDILQKFRERIILPVDFLATQEFSFPNIGEVHKCDAEKNCR